MKGNRVFAALLVILVLALISLQVLTMVPRRSVVHTVVLTWPLTEIGPHQDVSGYVANWTWTRDVFVTAVQVWMGNPLGVLWEGDVRVVLNNVGDFKSPDQLLVHYQFDKHAESPIPHQVWFQVGSENSGFLVRAGQTLWIWRVFVNISDNATTSGDGNVIMYYVEA